MDSYELATNSPKGKIVDIIMIFHRTGFKKKLIGHDLETHTPIYIKFTS